MAAPTHSTRVTPPGAAMKDGYQALITFAADADVSFWEKGVTPPSVDGGDAIEVTTMHNVDLRTFAARSLYTLGEGSSRVAYDPAVYSQIVALVNVHTTITVQFSTGVKISFFGFLRSFEPDELVEGSQPEATVNFTPTNTDASGTERVPLVGT